MEIDINNINNFDDIRRRFHFLSNISFRSVFLVLRVSLKLYYKRIIINNNLSNKEYVESINRSQLSYSSDG